MEEVFDQRNKKIGDVLNTAYWIFFLSIVLPFFSAFFILISGVGSLFLSDVSTLEHIESNPFFNFLSTIMWTILIIPLIKYSLDVKSYSDCIRKLAFKSISIYPLLGSILVMFVFSFFESLFFKFEILEVPSFLLELEYQTDSILEVVMLFIIVGVVGPFIEEIIFRGIAYERLKYSTLGPAGAVIMPSIIFTFIHTQYEQPILLALIFVSSCIFGWLRYFTGNLWYPIIGHVAMNVLSLSTGLL
ncbi:CPBP family intramembrane glutamic endopeptidase [Psychrosphaera saromensis]|nr:type II CAAX endopeptidase family protein [Psychrosphaera saromensis]